MLRGVASRRRFGLICRVYIVFVQLPDVFFPFQLQIVCMPEQMRILTNPCSEFVQRLCMCKILSIWA